jgi:hypothetical protein
VARYIQILTEVFELAKLAPNPYLINGNEGFENSYRVPQALEIRVCRVKQACCERKDI